MGWCNDGIVVGCDAMGVVGHMGYEFSGMGCCLVAGWSGDGGAMVAWLLWVWCQVWVMGFGGYVVWW